MEGGSKEPTGKEIGELWRAEDHSGGKASHLQKRGNAVWDTRGNKTHRGSHNSGVKRFILVAVRKQHVKFQSGDHPVIEKIITELAEQFQLQFLV